MATERIGKYLAVEELGIAGRKTKTWIIEGSDGNPLGQARWYSPWRQYTFWPTNDIATVLNKTCLHDLADFLERETTKHMEALTARDDSERTAPYSG